VLILCQPFNNNFGGGITQANLFSGWDKDKLAVACTVHMFSDLNTGICDTYYLLGNEEYKWKFPFNYLQRSAASGVVKLSADKGNESKPAALKPTLRARLVNNFFYPFLEFIGLFHSISKITLSDSFCKWLNEYNPDVIYAQASSRETVLFCSLVQTYLKKPMVFHMMDDWPSTISEKGPFKNYWRKKIDREFRDMLKQCKVLLGISDYMALEYKTRYGCDFITFHNPIELDFWRSAQRTQYKLKTPAKLLYAGRIGPGIQSSLELTAKAVEHMNQNTGISLQFVLQTKEKPAWVEQYSCVKHTGLVEYKDLPKVFAQADFLLLPYDFSDASIRFVKFSMPTKAPEYMVSGTPVIVYAPSETAIIRNAEENDWAKIISEESYLTFSGVLQELIMNENERKRIGTNAIRFAEDHFNAAKVRNKFRETISSLPG
jgi:glycosyltransferase involved in cell wall biosynthesis